MAQVLTIRKSFLAFFHSPFIHSGRFFEIVCSYSCRNNHHVEGRLGREKISRLVPGENDRGGASTAHGSFDLFGGRAQADHFHVEGSWSREISSLAPGENDGSNSKELDELAVNGVHYSFQAIVSSQLLVDVVKVIA